MESSGSDTSGRDLYGPGFSGRLYKRSVAPHPLKPCHLYVRKIDFKVNTNHDPWFVWETGRNGYAVSRYGDGHGTWEDAMMYAMRIANDPKLRYFR